MSKQACMIGLVAALAAAPAAFAGSVPAGSITGYLTMEELEEADGTGFGVRGWGSLSPNWFLSGEYQTVTLEADTPFGTAEADMAQMRFGGGFAAEMQQGTWWFARGEWIDMGGDYEEGGFGVHGGIIFMASPQFTLTGSLGYLTTDNTDGLEFDIGGKYSFTKEWGVVVDYRSYMGSVDPNGDFGLTDLRVGASYSFY